MVNTYHISQHDDVKQLLNIAKRHLGYIKKSQSKEITVPGIKVDHAVVASIFSAAAVEAGINLFLSIPVLYIQQKNIRKFFGSVISKTLRMSIRQKIELIRKFVKKLGSDNKLIKDINELFDFRNTLLHSSPEFIESEKITADFERNIIKKTQSIAELFSRGSSTSEAKCAFNHYKVALDFIKHLDVKIPNKTTLKAMKDAEAGRNLNSHKSLEDFFEKMQS